MLARERGSEWRVGREGERVEGAIGRDGRVCATTGRRRERGDCLEEERREKGGGAHRGKIVFSQRS